MADSSLLAWAVHTPWLPRVAAMSLTPIFDAVLADSDPDIFLAGLIFPRPVLSKGYKFPTPYDDRIDAMLYSWAAYDPRYKAKVRGVWANNAA